MIDHGGDSHPDLFTQEDDERAHRFLAQQTSAKVYRRIWRWMVAVVALVIIYLVSC